MINYQNTKNYDLRILTKNSYSKIMGCSILRGKVLVCASLRIELGQQRSTDVQLYTRVYITNPS